MKAINILSLKQANESLAIDSYMNYKHHHDVSSRLWALWILQIASAFSLSAQFDRAKDHLNQKFGGIPPDELYCPPGYISAEEECVGDKMGAKIQVPDIDAFSSELDARLAATDTLAQDGLSLALGTLLDDECALEWAWPVIQLLNSN